MLLDTINCFPKVQGVSKKRKIQWHSKVRLLGGVYTVQVSYLYLMWKRLGRESLINAEVTVSVILILSRCFLRRI